MGRGVLPLSVVLTLAGACVDDAEPSRTRPGESPPNILVVVVDDARADALRAMPKTRRWFARGGVRFTRAYVTTPLCCPSRASIFSGRYAHNHGVLENNDGDLLDPDSTIQHHLRRGGYVTAVAGKYLQGMSVSVDPPNFDRWATFGWGYFDRNFNVDGTRRVVRGYTTDILRRTVVEWLEDLETSDDRPWFVYVAPAAPHLPYAPAPAYRRTSVPRLRINPAMRAGDAGAAQVLRRAPRTMLDDAARVHRRQLRTLLSVDDLVDGVLRSMRALGESRDTLAFFTSDNGFMLGEHGLFGKRLPYRAAVEVPMLMRWPGTLPRGERDRRLVANIDIAPTIAAAAGMAPGTAMDGMSLLGGTRREALLLEEYENGLLPDWASVVTRAYQYVEFYHRRSGRVVGRDLFDLRRDPWQLADLAGRGRSSERIRRAKALLERLKSCAGEGCRGVSP